MRGVRAGIKSFEFGFQIRYNELKVNFRFSQSNAGGESWDAAYSIAENIQRSAEREKLQKQIAALENKIRKEKQFNRQVEMNAELTRLKKNLKNIGGIS